MKMTACNHILSHQTSTQKHRHQHPDVPEGKEDDTAAMNVAILVAESLLTATVATANKEQIQCTALINEPAITRYYFRTDSASKEEHAAHRCKARIHCGARCVC